VPEPSSHSAEPRSTQNWTLLRRPGFAGTAYAFLVVLLGTTLPTPLYSIYQADFGFSELTVTAIFATYATGVIAALLLFGRLSDQIGRRRVLLPGIALSALSAVVFLLAQDVGLLFAGRVLSGLSAGLFTGTATATLLDLAPPARRAQATLAATLVNMGGLACGPLLAGMLAEFAGMPLRTVFWVDLALLLPAAALVWMIPEPAREGGAVNLRPQRLEVPAEVRPIFIRAALAAFAGFAMLGFFSSVAPGFMHVELDIDNHATVGLGVFVVFAASLAGQTAYRDAPTAVTLPAGCGLLIAGIGLVALGLADDSLALLLGGGVVAAVGQGLSFRAGLHAINEATPADRRGEVVSSFFVVAYVAISIPVVCVGILAEQTSLRTAGLILAACVAALALTAAILLIRGDQAPSSA
jgi:MFS family permease